MVLLHSKRWWWLGAAFTGVALVVLFLFDPRSTSWYPPCIFHKLTGLDCPGCGSSRGLHCLLHGDLGRAADHNVLLFLALPLLASGFYYRLTGRGSALWQSFNRPRTLLLIICLFFLLRNTPGHALSWLNAN
jgi:hypothetical protein